MIGTGQNALGQVVDGRCGGGPFDPHAFRASFVHRLQYIVSLGTGSRDQCDGNASPSIL
jgi:hypothetical protein